MDKRIRLTSTNSVNSVDKVQNIDLDLEQHTKLFPFPSVSDTIDQREQFDKERKESDRYRLILTINPYCTNILFNPLTEIVRNEGSAVTDEMEIVAQNSSIDLRNENTIIGKNKELNSLDMIRNTEYTNCDSPFVYHCGYDIFNNHILRNQSFKVVNPLRLTASADRKKIFNTIMDFMRDCNGDVIKIGKRSSLKEKPSEIEAHLYTKEDILDIRDAIDANITEENGWFGFSNRSSIGGKERDTHNKTWNDLNISQVMNGEHEPCEFIEMYPDSTLYSFNPKYNPFQHREEHNWDICLTYPYKCDYNKELIRNVSRTDNDKQADGECNGLLMLSYERTIGTYGQEILMFRSYVKHNLHKNDEIKLFYTTDKGMTFDQLGDETFKVTNVGDIAGENEDYYFYVTYSDNFEDVIEPDDPDFDVDTDLFFRVVRVVNGVDCKYYFRKFRKLPNLKYKKEELTDDVAQSEEEFQKYIKDNAMEDDKKMLLFNREQYPLAFSNTIYGDGNTQVTFTDSIDIKHIVDNLGRPLTEMFVTIIKRNKGHDLWYDIGDNTDLTKIEYSHCFGQLDCGLEMHGEKYEDEELLEKRNIMHDVQTICNDEKRNKPLNEEEITIDTDEFFGDVVELNVSAMVETVLSDVCFRFNTEQRENLKQTKYTDFIYDVFETDDYDKANFNVVEEPYENEMRYEGYYYKAHYSVPLKEFGVMQQGSNHTLPIIEAKPKNADNLFIEIVTKTRHHLAQNDVLILCDNDSGRRWDMTVNSVQSNVRFLLNQMGYDVKNRLNIYQIVDGINNGNLKLRVKNTAIPSYAREAGSNIYLWRDVLTVGEDGTSALPEYPFANGHFYVNKTINFFLKRQDPFGYNGLRFDESSGEGFLPNDIEGTPLKTSVYEYKDDENIIC